MNLPFVKRYYYFSGCFNRFNILEKLIQATFLLDLSFWKRDSFVISVDHGEMNDTSLFLVLKKTKHYGYFERNI